MRTFYAFLCIISIGAIGLESPALGTVVLDTGNTSYLFEYDNLELVGPPSDLEEPSLDSITFDISLSIPLPPPEELPNITLTLYANSTDETPIIPATPLITSYIEYDGGFSYFTVNKLSFSGIPIGLQDLQGLLLFELVNPVDDFTVTLSEITIIQDSPAIGGRFESTFTIVPEPSSIALLTIGIFSLLWLKRRKASPTQRRLP